MANTAEICKRLKEIENLQETDELFHEVIECLSLKYNDVECVSVRVLAGWGSQRCVDTLKDCLLGCYPVKKNLSFVTFIIKSLGKCITKHDYCWVIDHFINIEGYDNKSRLFSIIYRIPIKFLVQKLEEQLDHENEENRMAAMCVFNLNPNYPRKKAMFTKLLKDSSSCIRDRAKYWLDDQNYISYEAYVKKYYKEL